MNERIVKVMGTPLVKDESYCVLYLTLEEAERAGEEAKRIKKENEIKEGDFAICIIDGRIQKVTKVEYGMVWYKSLRSDTWSHVYNMTKIINPAHIQALNEIYEAHK